MALIGDIKDFGLLQLLTLVQVTRKTGALTLQRGGETAIIYFEDGQMIKAKPPESRADGLATLLFRAGRIDQEKYDLITSQSPPSEQAVGLLLEDQADLSRDQIVEFVREKALANIYSLLTWPEGSFRFDVGSSPAEEEILAPTDLSSVLEKGRSYLEEWQLLASYIPSLDRPMRLLAEPRRSMEEIRLSTEEWRMVASLTANIPLKEVGSKLGLDEFAVRQVAYRLIKSGLADIPEPEFTPPPPKESWEPRESEEAKPGALARLFGRK